MKGRGFGDQWGMRDGTMVSEISASLAHWKLDIH